MTLRRHHHSHQKLIRCVSSKFLCEANSRCDVIMSLYTCNLQDVTQLNITCCCETVIHYASARLGTPRAFYVLQLQVEVDNGSFSVNNTSSDMSQSCMQLAHAVSMPALTCNNCLQQRQEADRLKLENNNLRRDLKNVKHALDNSQKSEKALRDR